MREPTAYNNPPAAGARFAPTQWSLILMAGKDGEQRDRALEKLCSIYWYPVYAFIRRRGHSPEDAQDFTQEFFARLVTRGWLENVDRERGARFSTFLLIMLKNFLADQHDRATAQKRGGGITPISLDFAQAEEWFGHEPSHDESPERVYERRWAWAILDQAAQRLAAEADAAGKGERFAVLRPFLSHGPTPGDYQEAAAKLHTTTAVITVAIQRLRQRFRAVLREELTAGALDEKQVDEELRDLAAALR